VAINRFIAAVATAKSESVDNTGLTSGTHGLGMSDLCALRGVTMNIYVGNLALEVTEDELRQVFTPFGQVTSVSIMNDKYIGSGQTRGYGFVEMPSRFEGEAAIIALSGKTLAHMTINVVEALPLSDKKDKGSYIYKRCSWARSTVRQRR
jgi:RNA recognition motif-containing protein